MSVPMRARPMLKTDLFKQQMEQKASAAAAASSNITTTATAAGGGAAASSAPANGQCAGPSSKCKKGAAAKACPHNLCGICCSGCPRHKNKIQSKGKSKSKTQGKKRARGGDVDGDGDGDGDGLGQGHSLVGGRGGIHGSGFQFDPNTGLPRGYSLKSFVKLATSGFPIGSLFNKKHRSDRAAGGTGGSNVRGTSWGTPVSGEKAEYTCPTCGFGLRTAKERNDFAPSGYSEVFRCTSCNARITPGVASKHKVAMTPIMELIVRDQLQDVGVPRLKAFLKEKGKPLSGSKAELVLRVKAAAGTAVGSTEKAAVQDQLQAKTELKLAKQAELDLWQTSWLVPEFAQTSFVHKPFACPGCFGWPSIENGCGMRSRELDRAVTASVGTDFAVGFASATPHANVVFYMPKKKKVVAVIHPWTFSDVSAMAGDNGLASVMSLLAYRWGAGYSANPPHPLRQKMWVQVCQPWSKPDGGTFPGSCGELRNDVAVLQREPGWTDVEEDFDSYWGKKNLYDKPRMAWGFTVPEAVYTAAWTSLFEFVKTQRGKQTFADPHPVPLSGADLKKMKVAELRALCEKKRLVKETDKRVLKADLVAMLMPYT
eukprot:gene20729-28956_t